MAIMTVLPAGLVARVGAFLENLANGEELSRAEAVRLAYDWEQTFKPAPIDATDPDERAARFYGIINRFNPDPHGD